MNKPLEGKIAVVTGAGRNMGQHEAVALAQAGAKVVVNSKTNADETISIIERQGGEAVPVICDASSWQAGETIINKAIDTFGRIDILVNNAGTHQPAPFEEMTEEQWDAVLNVSLKCYAATIRFAAPHFKKQGSGIIVNTGSTSGLGHMHVANYSAAKEGVLGLTRTVARDLGQYGVRCNMIRPVSLVSTLFTPELLKGIEVSSKLGLPTNGNRHHIFREGVETTGEQVAALVLLLCLPETAHVSGQDFYICGETAGRYPEPELIRTVFNPDGWTTDALLEPNVLDNLIGDIKNTYIRN